MIYFFHSSLAHHSKWKQHLRTWSTSMLNIFKQIGAAFIKQIDAHDIDIEIYSYYNITIKNNWQCSMRWYDKFAENLGLNKRICLFV